MGHESDRYNVITKSEGMHFASLCPRCNQLPIRPNSGQHLRDLCPHCLAQLYSCLPSPKWLKVGELPNSDGSSQNYFSSHC
jgi:phage FluMu protein Com